MKKDRLENMNIQSARRCRRLRILGWLLLGIGVLSPMRIRAEVHCYGKVILHKGDEAGPSIPATTIDLGKLGAYDTPAGHEKDCAEKTAAAAAKNPNFNNKTWLCQQIKQEGPHKMSAYAALGTLNYRLAASVNVTCTGAGAKVCTCPEGWTSNTSDSTGGGANSCKRAVCEPITGAPLPANGTQLGTWGFSWGNALYQWGKAKCVSTSWVGN